MSGRPPVNWESIAETVVLGVILIVLLLVTNK